MTALSSLKEPAEPPVSRSVDFKSITIVERSSPHACPVHTSVETRFMKREHETLVSL